jgi:Ca2+-binding EF-hand superfamily protein
MIKIGEKELKLITFFTYDLNQDGFICEEDIYYFISKLPYKSKILEDFNLII